VRVPYPVSGSPITDRPEEIKPVSLFLSFFLSFSLFRRDDGKLFVLVARAIKHHGELLRNDQPYR